MTAATSIAFFAMVGFEDSVNMVEETKEPERIFPRTMLTGLGIAVIIYMLVAVSVVSVLTSDRSPTPPMAGHCWRWSAWAHRTSRSTRSSRSWRSSLWPTRR